MYSTLYPCSQIITRCKHGKKIRNSKRQVVGDRRIAGQGPDDQQVSGPRFHGRGQHRPRPRSAAGGQADPGRIQGRGLGLPGRERQPRLRPGLHHSARQDGPGPQAQGAAQRRQRPVSGDGRRPRGRGHQLASARAAQAEGAGPSAGVSRNHQGGDPRGARASARHRRRPGAGPGSAADHRPAVRLRSFAAACGARCGRSSRPAACKAWPCG